MTEYANPDGRSRGSGRRPLLVVIGGLPAVGKTAVCRALLGERPMTPPMTWLRVDSIEQALRRSGEMAPDMPGGAGYYAAAAVAGDVLSTGATSWSSASILCRSPGDSGSGRRSMLVPASCRSNSSAPTGMSTVAASSSGSAISRVWSCRTGGTCSSATTRPGPRPTSDWIRVVLR